MNKLTSGCADAVPPLTPPPQGGHDDLVLACMAAVAEAQGCAVPLEVWRQGFAADAQGRMPLEAYPDMARQQGLEAVWSRMAMDKIPAHALPVIVPLKNGQACVLHQVVDGVAKVFWPGAGPQDMALPQLLSQSLGEVLRVQSGNPRHAQTLTPLHEQAFAWFWDTLWRFRSDYVESMVATVVANVLTLAGIFFTMNVYNRVVPTQAYATLWTLAIGTAMAAVLEFVMRWLKAKLVDLAGKKADLAINAMLLREIMSIRLEHRPQSVGIFTSAMRDFESLRDFFSSSSLVLLTDMPFGLLFLALIAMVAGPLVWVPLLVMPVLMAAGLAAQRPLMKAMRENMKEAGDRQSVLVEAVLNLEILKAHNAETYLQRRWETSNAASAQAHQNIRSLTNLVMGVTQLAQQLVTVVMVVAGVYMIHANQLTLGGLIAAVMLSGRALSPLTSVMALAARYQQARGSLQTLDGLIRRPRDRVHGRSGIVPQRVIGALEAQALEFAYPAEQSVPVIRKLSWKIEAGQRVALLGRVGSGKSTLLRLMAGLYKPSAGSIRLDGVALEQLEPGAIRRRMGYVGQDAQLFMGTLRENLVLSDTGISDARIHQVLRELDLYALVAAHPRGLDMPITEAGGGLSGGQKQLVCIARMMLRDPQLVFMDEPTASMDQTTEARVIALLKPWLQGRTVLMSTHRPPLLELVDSVAVVDAGQCVAMGDKAQILHRLKQGLPGAASACGPQPGETP